MRKREKRLDRAARWCVGFLLSLVFPLCVTAQEENTADSADARVDSLQRTLDLLTRKDEIRSEEEQFAKIWKQTKFISIAYGAPTLKEMETGRTDKGKFGVSVQMGKTFFLHKKPIAKMVKIGLDLSYINLEYAKYKSGSGLKFDFGGLGDDDDYDDYYDDDMYDDDDSSFDLDLGMHQLDYGIGFGPSVQVTPLYHVGRKWEYLKVFTYFHYTPTYSMIIQSEEDQTTLNHGFCSFFNFGIGLSYKMIGIGFESRWGKGKYNMASLDDNDVEDGFSSGDKQKLKTTASRFFISLRF